MTPDVDLDSPTRFQGLWLTAARVAWVVVVVVSVVVLLMALPARYAQLLSPEDEISAGLARQGYSAQYIEQYGTEAAISEVLVHLKLSRAGYAAYQLTLEAAVALAYIIVALVIFWRKSISPIGILTSLFLVTFGVGGSSYVLVPLSFLHSLGFVLVGIVSTLAYSNLPLFFYLFPDGRFVPRWTWMPAAAWAVSTFFWNLAPRSPLNPTNWPLWLYITYLLIVWVSSAAAQIYRYRSVSSGAQRQQTKWVVFGYGLMVLLLLLPVSIPVALGPSAESEFLYSIMIPMQTLAMIVIPVALAISILRYRLWDIDLLIRRTLIYSILSGMLALTYFGLVVTLQSLFTSFTGQSSPVVLVLSTLAIAALFFPLRRRVQNFIDKRFYRRKYDAAKTLADFAATARDETDLDKLTARLVEVVDETMQPESVGLWLKKETLDERSK